MALDETYHARVEAPRVASRHEVRTAWLAKNHCDHAIQRVPVHLAGFAWSRTWSLEALKPETFSGWKVPSDAREVHESRQVHHYDRVKDGYDVHYRTVWKHGKAKMVKQKTRRHRDEPVYRTWYEYVRDTWQQVDHGSSAGKDHAPRWPSSMPHPKARQRLVQDGSYSATFADDQGRTWKATYDLEAWQALTPDVVMEARIDGCGRQHGLVP